MTSRAMRPRRTLHGDEAATAAPAEQKSAAAFSVVDKVAPGSGRLRR
ncbi:MAG: hypothetical protein R2854_00385 [Caldilineaceae bacterium]